MTVIFHTTGLAIIFYSTLQENSFDQSVDFKLFSIVSETVSKIQIPFRFLSSVPIVRVISMLSVCSRSHESIFVKFNLIKIPNIVHQRGDRMYDTQRREPYDYITL